jgi:hypothetical protein
VDIIRSFRRNAVHVRLALEAPVAEAGRLQMDGGYLQDQSRIERYKRLSIPVRRALNPADLASFSQTLDALAAMPDPVPASLVVVRQAWAALRQELESLVSLGGHKVPRRRILADWLEAAAFYDTLDRDRAYDRLIEQWGTAAEGIASQLGEEAARVILLLDEAAASAIGEPVILPPPPKTPPPPPDPKEPWWKRVFT